MDLTTPAPRRLAVINSDGKFALPLPDPPGLVTSLHELRLRVMARTAYDHLFTELGTLEAAETAFRAGCDAIYIDTFGDYAIERIRALVDVPVVGAGEEGIRAAAAIGDFSVVTVWPSSMAYLYAERLGAVAGGERCRGVHHLSGEDELDRVGRSDSVKARMLRTESTVVEDLVALCLTAIERDGTQAVLLGCTCMAPVSKQLAEALDVPVVDPSRTGLAVAHASAQDAAPRTAPAHATRNLGLPAAVVDAYLASLEVESLALDDCEVCVVAGAVGPP